MAWRAETAVEIEVAHNGVMTRHIPALCPMLCDCIPIFHDNAPPKPFAPSALQAGHAARPPAPTHAPLALPPCCGPTPQRRVCRGAACGGARH